MRKIVSLLIMVLMCALASEARAATAAGTVISNGGDHDVVGADDTPGDTLVSFTYLGVPVTGVSTNTVLVTVTTGYALALTRQPVNATVLPGGTTYYPLALSNSANVSDTASFSVAVSSGLPWPVSLVRDDNGNGIHDTGETTAVTTSGVLAQDGHFDFFLAVTVPSTGTTGEFCAARITMKNQNGAGSDDSWPAAGNDTLVWVTTTTCVRDSTPPEIICDTANPSGLIGMIGNRVWIRARVSDPETGVSSIMLSYQIDAASATAAMTLTDGKYAFDLGSLITRDCVLKYSIVAANGAGLSAQSTEATVTVSRRTSSLPVTDGRIAIADGNPDDGATGIVIPPGAMAGPAAISLEQKDRADYTASGSLAQGTHPSAVYAFGPDGTVFRKAATMTLLYFDLDKDGKDDATGAAEDTLRAFWWDGFEWRYLGGALNKKDKTVTVPVMHFSVYAIFPANAPGIDDYRPKEKIITPNGDRINDFAAFGLGSDAAIKIFDTNGLRVRTLDGINIWDGTDDSGSVVESGAYIYQFRAGGTLVSGVIVVAK